MYLTLKNGTQLPIEESKELEPITIMVSFAENAKTNWLPALRCELDEGASMLAIPLPIIKLMGINPKYVGEEILTMADGQQSKAKKAKMSLRIKTTDGELVTLHEVDCLCPPDGNTVLIGRNVQQLFKKTIVQNELRELILRPKIKDWLGLGERS